MGKQSRPRYIRHLQQSDARGYGHVKGEEQRYKLIRGTEMSVLSRAR